MRRNAFFIRALASGALLVLTILSPVSCSRAKSESAGNAQSPVISFEELLPKESRKDQDRKDQISGSQYANADGKPHDLFYLNGLWSAVGAYDDDLYYDYDEIDEMSLVFENGWVAFTAGGETWIYPVEREDGNLFFTVTTASDNSPARVYLDYHDNGYYLGITPENDPTFQILFERQ